MTSSIGLEQESPALNFFDNQRLPRIIFFLNLKHLGFSLIAENKVSAWLVEISQNLKKFLPHLQTWFSPF